MPYVGLVASRQARRGVLGELRGDGVPTSCSSASTCPPASTSARARRPRSRCRSSRGSSRCAAAQRAPGGRARPTARRPDLRHDRRRRSASTPSLEHEGGTVYFCCEGCKAAFAPSSRACPRRLTVRHRARAGRRRLEAPRAPEAAAPVRRRDAARPRRRRRPRVPVRPDDRRDRRRGRGRARAAWTCAGAEVVVNDAYGEGCSSSIAAALAVVDPRCDVLVLMLGDQPGVTAGHGRGAAGRPRRRAARGVPLRRRARAPDRVRARACSASSPTCTATRACGGCSTARRRRVAEVPIAGPDPARRGHARGLPGRARGLAAA